MGPFPIVSLHAHRRAGAKEHAVSMTIERIYTPGLAPVDGAPEVAPICGSGYPAPVSPAACCGRARQDGSQWCHEIGTSGCQEGARVRITVTSVLVEDQAKALTFYTDVLGFEKKIDLPVGDDRWLTVASPEALDGVELLLEPNSNPAVPAREYQRALHDAGIPATLFTVDDVQAEYERLRQKGVVFTAPPSPAGEVTMAVFDDTCGNLIAIVSAPATT
jgi:catechol 2,3-dioxygenase-like lactoylglutathione lyase family enzyme